MAKYHVNAPDGHTYEVEGPDGASQDDVVRAVLAQHPESSKKPRTWGDFAHDLGNATVNTLGGVAQGVASIPDAVTQGIGTAAGFATQYAGHAAGAVADFAGGNGDQIRQTSDKYASVLSHPATIGGMVNKVAPQTGGTLGTIARVGGSLLGGATPAAGFGTVENAALQATGLGNASQTAGMFTQQAPTLAGRVINGARNAFNNGQGVGARVVAAKLAQDNIAPGEAAAQMTAANANGQPLMLADMGDNTRALAADVARQPGPARVIGLNAVRDRQIGDNPFGTNTVPSQSERVQSAIGRDLGPVTDPIAESQRLMDGAKAAAAPLYDKAYSAPGSKDFYENVQDLLNRPSMQKALVNARNIAKEEGRNPEDLGFVIDDNGSVSLPPQNGRYQPVALGDPKDELTRTTISGMNRSVSKVGPTDLVGWLRQNGGLQDQNSELSHMGLNNAARRGMPLVGQESRFGPLVNPSGQTFDDAAHAAWEAGYFPHFSDRPSVNEFLDAVRGTHEGWNRHFLPEDQGAVEQFGQHTAQNNDLRGVRAETDALPVNDTSAPAGPQPFAPMAAYGEKQVSMPTWQTYDYIKRGMDDVVEGYRDPTSGKLNLDTQGRAVNSTLRDFLGRVDQANPDYAAARAAYAGPASMRDALSAGTDAISQAPNVIRARMANMGDAEKAHYWLGMRSALAQKAAASNDGVNVVRTLVGSGAKRDALAEAAGGSANVENFLQSLEREQQMNVTYNKVTGGSSTAGNLLENQSNAAAFGDSAIKHFGQGGGFRDFVMNHGIRQAQGALRYGVGQAGQRAREDASALLFTSKPNEFLQAVNQGNASTQAANQLGRTVSRGTGQAAVTGLQAAQHR